MKERGWEEGKGEYRKDKKDGKKRGRVSPHVLFYNLTTGYTVQHTKL